MTSRWLSTMRITKEGKAYLGQNKLIVGLVGLAGAGKSTASRIISNEFGIPRRPFAFPLKRMIATLGFPSEVLDGPASVKELPTDKLDGKSLREAMQTLGTEWGRNCMGKNFWVNRWTEGLPELPGAVADDCRFENEVQAIRHLGGIVIRLDRMGAGVKGEGAKHASEQIDGLEIDVRLTNNGTVRDLEDGLLRAIEELTGHVPQQHSLLREFPHIAGFA